MADDSNEHNENNDRDDKGPLNPLNKKQFNEARIQAWRAQRLASAETAAEERRKKAESDRVLRVEQSKRLRQEELELIEKEKKELALQKLPSLEKIHETRQAISFENHRRKRLFLKKLALLIVASLLVTILISCLTTPFYEAESIVTIKTNALNNGPSTSSSIVPTSVSPNIMQYLFSAREYIYSRDMMHRMEKEQGYLSYFKNKGIHFLSQPFSSKLTGRDDYSYYKRRVKVAIDLQEGLLRIKVQAKNQEDSTRFANALLGYAEHWVNALSDRMFKDKIKEAEDSLSLREKKLEAARLALVNFQISKRDVNPRETIAEIYKNLHDIKTKIKEREREIAVYKRSNVNESPVVERLRGQLSILRQQQKSLHLRLIDKGELSMNKVLSGFESALIEKDVAEKEWEVALKSLENVKSDIFNQRQYFLTIVPPISSSLPVEPQLISLFLLIFIALYGLVTVTALIKTGIKISVKT
jgi:capsular polysaccharide transport system permease protein